MNKFKAWLDNLPTRDQWILMGGVIFATLMIGYGVIWSPLKSKIATLEKTAPDNRELYAWMKASVQEIEQLRAQEQQKAKKDRGDQSLLGLVDSTARANKLGNAVKRIQPSRDGGAQVWLNNANFDQFLVWITELEEYGVVVDVVKLKALNQPGYVNVELMLKDK